MAGKNYSYGINKNKGLVMFLIIFICSFVLTPVINGANDTRLNEGKIVISPSSFDFGLISNGQNISGSFTIKNLGSTEKKIGISVSGAFFENFYVDPDVTIPGDSVKTIDFWCVIPRNAKAGVYATYLIIATKETGVVAVASSVLIKYSVKGLSIISISVPPVETGNIAKGIFRVAYIGYKDVVVSGIISLEDENGTNVFNANINNTVFNGVDSINLNGSLLNYQKSFYTEFGILKNGKYKGNIILNSNTSLIAKENFSFIVGKKITSISINLRPTDNAGVPALLNVTIINKGDIPDHVLVKVDVVGNETHYNHFEEYKQVLGKESILIYILPPGVGNYSVITTVYTDSGSTEQNYPLIVLFENTINQQENIGSTGLFNKNSSYFYYGILLAAFILGFVLGKLLSHKNKGKHTSGDTMFLPSTSFVELWLFLESGEALGRYDLIEGKELEPDEAIIAKITLIASSLNGLKNSYLSIKGRNNPTLLVTFIDNIGIGLKPTTKVEKTTIPANNIGIHSKLLKFVKKHRINLIRGLVSIDPEELKKLRS